MKLEDAKLSLYKYKMKSFIITVGSGEKAVKEDVASSEISNFEIVHDYEKAYFPFFTITVTVPNEFYRTLTKPENSTKIKVKMQLQRGKFKDAIKMETDSGSNFRDVIKGTFVAIIGPKEQDATADVQKAAEKSDNQYGQLSSITMALYPSSFYNKYDIVVNAVLETVTLMDVAVYCMNKTKINKMLVSPPDNHKSYSEFRIVPIPFNEQISRLCNTYAFHKKGSIVYFDLDRGYIIDKNPKCTAYTENEYKNTYIAQSTNSSATSQTGGGYENSEKKYFLLNATSFGSGNKSGVTKKDVGNNVVSVNANGKVTKTNKKATKVTRVVVQNEGENTAKAIKTGISETKHGINCAFSNIDILAFTPNKQFIVAVEGTKNKNYNGKYRMTYCDHRFEKEGQYFAVTTTAMFL